MSEALHPPPSSTVYIRVNYSDVDRMGLLHHAAYLRYFERCREEFSRRRGASYAEMEDNGWLIVVVDATVKYRLPARFDEVLAIEVRLVSVGHAALRFEYDVRREGSHTVIATAITRHPFVDRDGRLPRIYHDPPDLFPPPDQVTTRRDVG